jgi:hypothetical protein
MATVIPFPRARHSRFVEKHAANAASMSVDAGEKYIAYQMRVQLETMLRRGVTPDLAEAEVEALELAIWARFWGFVASPGGAA